jgi:hypothetical protein
VTNKKETSTTPLVLPQVAVSNSNSIIRFLNKDLAKHIDGNTRRTLILKSCSVIYLGSLLKALVKKKEVAEVSRHSKIFLHLALVELKKPQSKSVLNKQQKVSIKK